MRHLLLLTAVLLSIAFPKTATAVEGAPPFIDYQGSVLDDQGNPLAPNSPALYKMEFRIWDQIGGGNLIWSEAQTVTVYKGQFSVRLGEGTAASDTVPPKVPQNQLPLAFEGQNRFLGVTVVTNPQQKTEITPRLSFLTTPYAHIANTASVVTQQIGTTSSLVVSGIGYSTRKVDQTTTAITLAIDQHTNLVAAGPTGTTATLPVTPSVNEEFHELLITKTDDSLQVVTVAPPAGGQINGGTASIRLKVKGEGVTLQNAGGDSWWIVDDTRDNTPVGTIVSYGSQEPPPGYLACDGATITTTDYPELNAAIGNLWGGGTTFKVPDLTGRLLRGSGALTRTVSGTSYSQTLTVGTLQTDAMFNHQHTILDKAHGHGSGGGKGSLSFAERNWAAGGVALWTANDPGPAADVTPSPTLSVSSATTGLIVDSHGGSETRADNAGVRYCIKY